MVLFTYENANNDNRGEEVTVTGFEGPEKKLELEFKKNKAFPEGFRSISSEEWQKILDLVHCTIISQTKGTHFDAYVLSESSLFVYPYRIILKTCGTTTLLNCLDRVLFLAKDSYDANVTFVLYSRKNFLFPGEQRYPHNSFDSEVATLNKFFDGDAYVLGPVSGDHWNLYLADYSTIPLHEQNDQILEIMMHELDPTVMELFSRNQPLDGKGLTKSTGIADLIPGAVTDEFLFNPCGYSMNGLKDHSYETIHVTPEPHCSYVSYETNLPMKNCTKLIKAVLNIFKPHKFTLTLFSDPNSEAKDVHTAINFNALDGYCLKNKTVYEFENDYSVVLCNYESNTTKKKILRRVESSGAINNSLLFKK